MWKSRFAVAAAVILAGAGVVRADAIIITIKNLQKPNGVYLTPVVFTLHDGQFLPFLFGEAAPVAVERIAEDGTVDPMVTSALASPNVSDSKATMGGPIAPGESRTMRFRINFDDPTSHYLSFISMVIPSNDAFIANVHPMEIPIFNDAGNVIQRFGNTAWIVYGDEVWDAGTEVNDEVPENTAFLSQMMPDTGVVENGVIAPHPGFIGSKKMGGGQKGNVLIAYPQGDFTRPNVRIASISVTRP